MDRLFVRWPKWQPLGLIPLRSFVSTIVVVLPGRKIHSWFQFPVKARDLHSPTPPDHVTRLIPYAFHLDGALLDVVHCPGQGCIE